MPLFIHIIFRNIFRILARLFGVQVTDNVVYSIPTLYVSKFKFERQPDDDNIYVLQVIGRNGFGPESYLTVSTKELRVLTTGRYEAMYFSAPLNDIRASNCSLEKPFGQLVFGLTATTFGLATLSSGLLIFAVPAIVVGIIGIFAYIRSRRLVISFSTSELNSTYGLAFKSGLIGTKIDHEAFFEATLYVNHYIILARQSLQEG